jgi:hypothetical protein
MVAEIRSLNPRPGAGYHTEPAETLVPDVMVREGLGGMWHVELNTDTLPRVLVDQRYHARVSKGARTDQEKTFVSDCMATANWLVKSLDQRAKTILKVSSEIVRQQDGFLAFGVEHLRQDQGPGRRRENGRRRSLRRRHRGNSQGGRGRHRPSDRGQVPRGHADPVVGRAPPIDEGFGLTAKALVARS